MRRVDITATTLDGIRQVISNLAELIDAPHDYLPAYGTSPQTGLPHIEKDNKGFHWVVAERGTEFERRTTLDPHELLYWVFETVTFEMAIHFELRNRRENQDSRRIAFHKQLELLGELDHSWQQRARNHHNQILLHHPFDDNNRTRSTLARKLRDDGFSDEAAWRIAQLHYPPPKPATTEHPTNTTS